MNKIYLIFILSAGLLFSACSDLIESADDGRLTYDQIFSDLNLTGGYLNQCYTYIPPTGMGYANASFLATYSDEAHDADAVQGGNSANYYAGTSTSKSFPIESGGNGNTYNDMYMGIRKCNVFIDNIDKATFEPASFKVTYKAEAYALRAFYFWHLIKRMGPMPIIREDLPTDFDYSTIKRPSFYECVKAIVEDCDSAMAQPGFPWRLNTENTRGSMSKSVCVAIKSQAMLFAASPLWNNGENHWAEAAEVTKDALDNLISKGFSLYNPMAATPTVKAFSDYQRFFLLKPDLLENPIDKETIYAQKGQIGTVWQNHGLPIVANVTKAGTCPSQELIDSYETVNGMPVLNPANPYLDADHLQPNYNSTNTQYDPAKPYENRDSRMLSSVYCNGVNHNLSTNTLPVWTYVGGTSGISETDRRFTRTGYYLRKFTDFTSTFSANKDGYWRYFRLAEMYLNYAEAEFYANGVTPAAVNALNQTRLRAGLPALPNTISSIEFEQRLRNERRVEFAFEEHRYFDVRRWKIQAQTEGLVTGMKITQTAPNTYTYERIVVSRRPVTAEKYLKWPIPFTEELKFKNFGVSFQNQGW